ncbi:MAG: T6SS immunity protein Tdi1 domain-containing protein [Cyanobacteria bacterium P01_E01_bin.45]
MSIVKAIQDAWGWTGLVPERVVGENDFGNYLIKDVNGRYWRLCPEDLYCVVVANDRNELDALSRNPEFLHDWYMRRLVELAHEKLGQLEGAEKYHFKIPGLLGGEYGESNLCTVPQMEQIRFSGELAFQLQDLPDGTKVKLNFI